MDRSNTWFSNEEGKKGTIKAGRLADIAVLSADYLAIPEDQIKDLTSVLTVIGGNIVYADGTFNKLAPPLPRASPAWSPVNTFGGYYKPGRQTMVANQVAVAAAAHQCTVHGPRVEHAWFADIPAADQREFCSAFGCNCWMA